MFYRDERLTVEGPCTLLVPEWVIDGDYHVFNAINCDSFMLAEQQDRELFGRRFKCLTMLSACELVSTYFQNPAIH